MKYIFYRGPKAGQLVSLNIETRYYFEGEDRYLVYDGGLLLHSPVSASNVGPQRNVTGMDEAVDRAIRELRDGWGIRIVIQQGSGTVELLDPQRNLRHVRDDEGLAHEVLAAIRISANPPGKLGEQDLEVIENFEERR